MLEAVLTLSCSPLAAARTVCQHFRIHAPRSIVVGCCWRAIWMLVGSSWVLVRCALLNCDPPDFYHSSA
eukprot:4528146-Alexandrium_andersonii.AAC.1